jgi:hypothetical protein
MNNMNLRTDRGKDLGHPDPGSDGERVEIPPCIDTRENLGFPPLISEQQKLEALFDCQECGKRFPATFDGEKISAITCSCGADYTYLTGESSTEELLGL